eukprot:14129236-Alexandrium_andersonii.AAC.1
MLPSCRCGCRRWTKAGRVAATVHTGVACRPPRRLLVGTPLPGSCKTSWRHTAASAQPPPRGVVVARPHR